MSEAEYTAAHVYRSFGRIPDLYMHALVNVFLIADWSD
jgi:hypothetical protein